MLAKIKTLWKTWPLTSGLFLILLAFIALSFLAVQTIPSLGATTKASDWISFPNYLPLVFVIMLPSGIFFRSSSINTLAGWINVLISYALIFLIILGLEYLLNRYHKKYTGLFKKTILVITGIIYSIILINTIWASF